MKVMREILASDSCIKKLCILSVQCLSECLMILILNSYLLPQNIKRLFFAMEAQFVFSKVKGKVVPVLN
jgi:hypothetical protein